MKKTFKNCKECNLGDTPENFSSSLLPFSTLIKSGFHVHKNGNGYSVFKNDGFVKFKVKKDEGN